MKKFKLGRKKSKYDPRTLHFSSYVRRNIAPPPASIDWMKAVKTWPMDGNDTKGDCVLAGADHQIRSWSANASVEAGIPLDRILATYSALSPNDQGVEMLRFLKIWRAHGFAGDTLVSFASVRPQDTVMTKNAINIFGGAYIGVELPDFVVNADDPLEIEWDWPDGAEPNPENGHCIPLLGYDSDWLYAVTWGAVKRLSWEFYNKCCDESYALLSNDFIKISGGQSPAGFDLQQMIDDMKWLGGVPPQRR